MWSSSSSGYAGFALNGSIIKPQPEDDQAYYGRLLGPSDVVFGHRGTDHGLRRELATTG